MGSQFSKKPSDGAPPPIQINTNLQCTAELSSYEAACQLDPELQTFDATLHQRTNQVINTLADGVEVRSLSFDSLKEVAGCLHDTNQEVVKMILECEKDIWKNQELSDLVKEYFDSSLQTLDFCTELDKCLKGARKSQLIIQVVLQQFEEEQQDGIDGKKYLRTLQELKNFKAEGDPFTEDFFSSFQSVYKQQVSMFEKLQLKKRKLDKKLNSLKAWRTVSNVIFVAAFASVLIFSVVAAAIAAPPVVTALAAALAVPIGSMGKWVNLLWDGYENALKGKKEIVSSLKARTYIAIKELENIWVLTNKLEIEIESLLQNADCAMREEDAVKLVIDEIKKKLSVFMETIEDLGEHVDMCSRNIVQARMVILQRILN